jgi:hypothetical protein
VRGIEHFLSISLSNTFGRPLDDCVSVLDKIPVIHLHGRLGYLPWQSKTARPYGDHTIDGQAMNICLKEIKVVHEDITDRDKDFARAVFDEKPSSVILMPSGLLLRHISQLQRSGELPLRDVTT